MFYSEYVDKPSKENYAFLQHTICNLAAYPPEQVYGGMSETA